MSHCEKKLPSVVFDFEFVAATDDYCEQQVPSVALRLQQMTTPDFKIYGVHMKNRRSSELMLTLLAVRRRS